MSEITADIFVCNNPPWIFSSVNWSSFAYNSGKGLASVTF